MFEALCKEKEGAVWRSLRIMPRSMDRILSIVEKLKQVKSFLDPENPYVVFLDRESLFFEIDEVGLIAVCPWDSTTQHCHITFWDGRLRGREGLCRTLAEFVVRVSHKNLVTAIPADRRAVVAFAKRVGFTEVQNNNGVLGMLFTNYTE